MLLCPPTNLFCPHFPLLSSTPSLIRSEWVPGTLQVMYMALRPTATVPEPGLVRQLWYRTALVYMKPEPNLMNACELIPSHNSPISVRKLCLVAYGLSHEWWTTCGGAAKTCWQRQSTGWMACLLTLPSLCFAQGSRVRMVILQNLKYPCPSTSQLQSTSVHRVPSGVIKPAGIAGPQQGPAQITLQWCGLVARVGLG